MVLVGGGVHERSPIPGRSKFSAHPRSRADHSPVHAGDGRQKRWCRRRGWAMARRGRCWDTDAIVADRQAEPLSLAPRADGYLVRRRARRDAMSHRISTSGCSTQCGTSASSASASTSSTTRSRAPRRTSRSGGTAASNAALRRAAPPASRSDRALTEELGEARDHTVGRLGGDVHEGRYRMQRVEQQMWVHLGFEGVRLKPVKEEVVVDAVHHDLRKRGTGIVKGEPPIEDKDQHRPASDDESAPRMAAAGCRGARRTHRSCSPGRTNSRRKEPRRVEARCPIVFRVPSAVNRGLAPGPGAPWGPRLDGAPTTGTFTPAYAPPSLGLVICRFLCDLPPPSDPESEVRM